jgi:hypothetical protein
MKDEKFTMVLLAGVSATTLYLVWKAHSASASNVTSPASTSSGPTSTASGPTSTASGFAQVINNYNTNSGQAPQPSVTPPGGAAQSQVVSPMAAVMANSTVSLPSFSNYGIDVPGSTSTSAGVVSS